MIKYTIRRLLQMVPVLILVSIAVFSIIYAIPGDPASIIAGSSATEEQLAALRSEYGLDQSIWVQYGIWLRNVVTFDFGNSLINDFPIRTLMLQRIPATVELALAAAVVAALIAFPLGILSALRAGGTIDRITTTFAALAFAIPGFWLAILLILVFSLQLKWLPPSGRPDLLEQPLEHLKALAMPALVLGTAMAAQLTRYLRSSMLDELNQDYVRSARGKGLRQSAVVRRHVLPNTMIPVVTVFGLMVGELLSGAIIVESIFAWPGVGRLTIQAVGWRDYPLLQTSVMFIVLTYLLVNLLTDLTYARIDPRIRYQ